MITLICRVLTLAGLLLVPLSHAETLTVAVAANFADTLDRLSEPFAQTTGHQIAPVIGASGLLYAQIVRGAPFDVFLSADAERPDQLISAGQAIADSRVIYAEGRLALWQPGAAMAPTLATLASVDTDRLAIANPQLAPYGRAAEGFLRRSGAFEQWRQALVYGQNIAGTYAIVASGNAPLGLVALAQLRSQSIPESEYWLIPAHQHPVIEQVAVLTLRGSSKASARAFMAWLSSPQAQAIIANAGYGRADSGGLSGGD